MVRVQLGFDPSSDSYMDDMIRRAHASDAERICRTHVASIRRLCSTEYSPEQIAAWVGTRTAGDYLKAIEVATVFVAEREGEIAGFAIFDVEEGLILAIYVHPDQVRRGIGSRLLKAIEAEAQAAGLSKLWLNATLNSVMFYQARGYDSLGATTNTLPNGVDLACVRMEKRLRRAGPSEESASS